MTHHQSSDVGNLIDLDLRQVIAKHLHEMVMHPMVESNTKLPQASKQTNKSTNKQMHVTY